MARPQRNNVDYFPFLCKVGKPMRIIMQKYGNDGFAVWIKILRELAITNYHHLSLANHLEVVYIAAVCNVSEDLLIDVIGELCSIGEFDNEIWKKHRAIYSQKFIDSIQDAYKKRENKCIDREGVLHILTNGHDHHKPEKNKTIAPVQKKDIYKTEVRLDANGDSYIETWLKDLPNSSHLERIASLTGIKKETLISRIPEFRKKVEMGYPSQEKFLTHFKNWVVKENKEVQSNNKTTVTFGKKHG